MELLCPVCNGLEELEYDCPFCSQKTEDCGAVKNFLGPYSPYDENPSDLLVNQLDLETGNCVHLVSCPTCGKDKRITIGKVIV